MAPVFLGAPNYEACPEGFQYTHNTPVPMENPLYDVNLTGRGYATLTKLTWDLRLPEPDDELNEIGL